MYFSNILKDDGSPDIWNIEKHIFSLKLKIIEKNIHIIAIANQTGIPGLGTKIVDVIHNFSVINNYKIIIVNDESNGYWNKIIEKYNDDIIYIK